MKTPFFHHVAIQNNVVIESKSMATIIPPAPTKQNPFCQIQWIANICADGYDNKQSAEHPKSTVNPYVDYLITSRGRNPYYIEIEWDELELIKFGDYLIGRAAKNHPQYITSYTRKGYYSGLKMLMGKAYALGIINSLPLDIVNPKIGDKRPETDVNTSFEESRFRTIQKVINSHCRISKLKASNPLQPYVKQHIGSDPRRKFCAWKEFDNLVWYFENIMNCIPHRAKSLPGDKDPHKNFFHACQKWYDGIEIVYNRLGVETFSTKIGIEFIAPLVNKLAIETGFNIEVLDTLEQDCFTDAHELTGKPYIKYTKTRSGGDKELHTSLLEDSKLYAQQTTNLDSSKEQYLWLNPNKTKKIKAIIDLITLLTEPIRNRESTSNKFKNRLFLVEVAVTRNRRRALEGTPLSHSRYVGMHRWKKENLIPDIITELVSQMKLVTQETEWKVKTREIIEDVSNESFSIGKFRATLATSLVIKGAPLEVIQAWLGHENISTTLGYIDRHHLKIRYQREVTEALKVIKDNTIKFHRKEDLPIATSLQQSGTTTRYQNSFCFCLNPLDPPKNVKVSKHWSPGTPCTFWNMCLFCSHILITPDSLPKIIAYKWRILELINSGHGQEKENDIYIKTLFTIDTVLKSNIFTDQELENAKQLAEIHSEVEMDAHLISGIEK